MSRREIIDQLYEVSQIYGQPNFCELAALYSLIQTPSEASQELALWNDGSLVAVAATALQDWYQLAPDIAHVPIFAETDEPPSQIISNIYEIQRTYPKVIFRGAVGKYPRKYLNSEGEETGHVFGVYSIRNHGREVQIIDTMRGKGKYSTTPPHRFSRHNPPPFFQQIDLDCLDELVGIHPQVDYDFPFIAIISMPFPILERAADMDYQSYQESQKDIIHLLQNLQKKADVFQGVILPNRNASIRSQDEGRRKKTKRQKKMWQVIYRQK